MALLTEHTDVPPNKYVYTIPEVAEQCFFCGKPAKASESLHHASTLDLDAHVRQCALQLQGQNLLAKLSAGDLIAKALAELIAYIENA